jgi:large subunit ribosomal protein L3
MLGLIGQKIGMTQLFQEDGTVVPVTVIKTGPCKVVQVKTKEKDSYNALQLGYEEVAEHRVNKPRAGHFAKNGVKPCRHIKEFRVESVDQYKNNDEIKSDIFKVGDKIDVRGISKGKGFQGVVKRWGFHGGRWSHGSRFHRAPGSIGMCASPAETLPGTKLPGQTGNRKKTVQNLVIIKVLSDKDCILVRGAVPGHKNGVLLITPANKVPAVKGGK